MNSRHMGLILVDRWNQASEFYGSNPAMPTNAAGA